MYRVIIPVDFSETALNAARFTASMMAGIKDTLVVLYHNYETEDDRDIVTNFMETLKKDLMLRGDSIVEYRIEMGGDLVENLAKVTESLEATLIVMGITSKSALEQIIIGSNTLKMVDRGICPVLIIPSNAVFHSIKNVAFASDFKNVRNTTLEGQINAVLKIFDPRCSS